MANDAAHVGIGRDGADKFTGNVDNGDVVIFDSKPFRDTTSDLPCPADNDFHPACPLP
jgi:hypothetical protein